METMRIIKSNNRTSTVYLTDNSFMVINMIDENASRVHPSKYYKTITRAVRYANTFLNA
jgi:hypothetical protein